MPDVHQGVREHNAQQQGEQQGNGGQQGQDEADGGSVAHGEKSDKGITGRVSDQDGLVGILWEASVMSDVRQILPWRVLAAAGSGCPMGAPLFGCGYTFPYCCCSIFETVRCRETTMTEI